MNECATFVSWTTLFAQRVRVEKTFFHQLFIFLDCFLQICGEKNRKCFGKLSFEKKWDRTTNLAFILQQIQLPKQAFLKFLFSCRFFVFFKRWRKKKYFSLHATLEENSNVFRQRIWHMCCFAWKIFFSGGKFKFALFRSSHNHQP